MAPIFLGVSSPTTSPWRPAPDSPVRAEPTRPRRARRWMPPLLCISVYTALAAFVYGAHSPVTSAALPPCACGDVSSQTWMLSWPAYALSSGHNPFYSSFVAYPGGVNLMSNTAAPLLGFLMAPVTLTLGPVSAFNLVMRLAFVLSAVSMCFVLRRWTRWWPAAFIGGLIYAYSPYMEGQGLSHNFLLFVPLPPLMLALLDEILLRRRHPVRNGILLGAAATAQLLISAEVLLMFGLLAAFGLVVLVLRHPVGFVERVGDIVRGLGAAALTGAVLAGYPLWMYFAGPYHISGPPHPTSLLSQYYSSVDGLIYPSTLQRFTLGHWLVKGQAVTQGGNSEYTTYLGIPLLILMALILVRFRRVGLVPFFSLIALVAWVITLGPTLHLGTTHHPAIKLPYYWLQSVALINGALDLRYSLIMYLAAAVVVAVGLDRFTREGLRAPFPRGVRSRRAEHRRGALSAVIAVIALLPLTPRLPYTSSAVTIPPLFTAKTSPIADGDVVLSLPLPVGYIGSNDQALLWQAGAKMRYKLIGFRGAVPGADHRPVRDAALLLPPLQAEDLLSWGLYGQPAPPPPADAATYAAIRTFLVRYHVGAVTIVPFLALHWQAVIPYFTAALGAPPVAFGGGYVWPHVQADLAHPGTS
jgi:hypothetical protein